MSARASTAQKKRPAPACAMRESTVKCGQSCSHFGFGRRFQRRMPLLELGAQGAIEGSGSGLQHEVRASF